MRPARRTSLPRERIVRPWLGPVVRLPTHFHLRQDAIWDAGLELYRRQQELEKQHKARRERA